MKKILFGAILAAVGFYYFHPEAGAERRKRLSGMWGARKEDVLEAAKNTTSVVAGVSHGVGEVVGTKIAARRTEGESSNGNVLTGAASTRSAE
jgi:hypothetical protein